MTHHMIQSVHRPMTSFSGIPDAIRL